MGFVSCSIFHYPFLILIKTTQYDFKRRKEFEATHSFTLTNNENHGDFPMRIKKLEIS